MTHEDDRLDDALLQALRELDPPPATPRDEIWAGIQARRAARDNSNGSTVPATSVVRLRPRRNPWLQWGAALAAMLVVGIGLGRLSTRQAVPGDAPTAAAPVAQPAAGDEVPVAYRVAASQHLQRTEALFASLTVDAQTRGAGEVSSWARELLTDTRLLLGSPAAEDPTMRRLLEDLELLLSQIAMIPAARADEEVELIQDGLNQSDVLMRLRAATAGPALVGT